MSKTKSLNYWSKKVVAFMLIIVMSVPGIAMGADLSNAEELAWQQQPEIEPFDPSTVVLPIDEDYAELRLNDLLDRMNAIDTFTAEERFIVEDHLGTYESMLAELAPVELEAFLQYQAQLNELARCPRTRAEEAFHALLATGVRYSSLSEDERELVLTHLFIADEARGVTDALFTMIEQDGFALSDSVALIQIIGSGYI